jgi:hypothetical protein
VTSISAKSTLRARAPDGRRDIARGFKLLRRWQQHTRPSKLCGSMLTVCKKRGGREEALALFRHAAAEAPDSVDTQVDPGAIFANLDHPKEAVGCFQKALASAWHSCRQAIWRHSRPLAIHPDFVQAHIYRRAVVGRWRHYARARRPLLEALDLPLTNAGPRSGSTVSDHA